MTPFYLLLASAAIILLAMMLSLLRVRGARLRGEPFERRALLTDEEQRCYQMLSEVSADAYRVCPRVAAVALLSPLPRIGRKQRRLAQELLATGWVDLLICSASDLYPLVAVWIKPAKAGRAQRRLGARLQAAFASAGMPVIELTAGALPTAERLRELVAEATSMADVRLIARPEPMGGDDEDELLAELSAAMREPDGSPGR